MKNQAKKEEINRRLSLANELVALISSTDRQFLSKKAQAADGSVVVQGPVQFEISPRGLLRFQDGWSKKWVYPYERMRPKVNFSQGGTMWSLVKLLCEWIRTGEPRRTCVIYSPHWGYTEEGMKKIRTKAEEIGYLSPSGKGDGWT